MWALFVYPVSPWCAGLQQHALHESSSPLVFLQLRRLGANYTHNLEYTPMLNGVSKIHHIYHAHVRILRALVQKTHKQDTALPLWMSQHFPILLLMIPLLQTNSVALSPQANYTDWATATCRWNLVPTFVERWVSRGQRGRSSRSLISVF
jgi:hypothetical protein